MNAADDFVEALVGRPLSAFPVPWRVAAFAALALFAGINLFMAALQVAAIFAGSDAADWHVYRAAVERFGAGTMYDISPPYYYFRYSPVAVIPLAVVAWIGDVAWRALHLVALVALPGRLRWLALGSYAFWLDLHVGNVMVFVVIAAYWALRGNSWGAAATFVLALLVPRPLMIPLVGWLLLTQPRSRLPFLGLFVAHAVAVLVTGYGPEWISMLLETTADMVPRINNVAPSAVLGLLWLVLAVPLATWSLWRRLPATAGLLLQTYWLPQYPLILLADRWSRQAGESAESQAAERAPSGDA